jgi:hypothetical protein
VFPGPMVGLENDMQALDVDEVQVIEIDDQQGWLLGARSQCQSRAGRRSTGCVPRTLSVLHCPWS